MILHRYGGGNVGRPGLTQVVECDLAISALGEGLLEALKTRLLIIVGCTGAGGGGGETITSCAGAAGHGV